MDRMTYLQIARAGTKAMLKTVEDKTELLKRLEKLNREISEEESSQLTLEL
jgi:hypothetical protein